MDSIDTESVGCHQRNLFFPQKTGVPLGPAPNPAQPHRVSRGSSLGFGHEDFR